MSIAYKISGWNRRRKWQLFLDHLKPQAATTILDVGFNEKEYSATDNFLEKKYPYPEKITALGIDTPEEFLKRYPRVKAVQYDGKKFPFPDKSFDICWSNAVLEHVGGLNEQQLFLSECRRVAQHGFITTPNRLFPIEVHTRTPFLHWLPERWFHRYLSLIGKKWATGNYMHLLNERDLRHRLKEAGFVDYTIIRNRLLGFTLDFVVIW